MDAEVARLEDQGLLDGEERVEVDLLRHQAHRAPGDPVVAHGVVAEYLDLAGGRAGDAGDQADERRLARSVGAQKTEDLAATDVERDVVEGGEIAVSLGRIAQAHGRRAVLGHRVLERCHTRAEVAHATADLA